MKIYQNPSKQILKFVLKIVLSSLDTNHYKYHFSTILYLPSRSYKTSKMRILPWKKKMCCTQEANLSKPGK